MHVSQHQGHGQCNASYLNSKYNGPNRKHIYVKTPGKGKAKPDIRSGF